MLFDLPEVERNEGDYEKSGVLYCGNCNSPKTINIDGFGDNLPIMCRCRRKAIEAQRLKMEQQSFIARVNRIRAKVKDKSIFTSNFEIDAYQKSQVSKTARRYVEKWEEVKNKNIGIILTGGVGTGKTFYAGCIANAIIDKGFSVQMFSLSDIINADFDDKKELLADVERVSLLVLDDIGTERQTSYGYEIVEQVIDTRYQVRKPIIVTTNLSMDKIRTALDIQQTRMYDRILEMCPIQIAVTGKSKRQAIRESKAEEAKRILESE